MDLTFALEDMASYDDKGAYSANGSYVIEACSYTLALRTDSHTDKGAGLNTTLNIARPIVYNTSSTDSNADTSVTKRLSDLVTVNKVFGSYNESTLNGNLYSLNIGNNDSTSPYPTQCTLGHPDVCFCWQDDAMNNK